jgi:hypothetical protein
MNGSLAGQLRCLTLSTSILFLAQIASAQQSLTVSPNPSTQGSAITLSVSPACGSHSCPVSFYWGTSATSQPNNLIQTTYSLAPKITWTPPSAGTFYLYAISNYPNNLPQYGPPTGTNKVTEVVNSNQVTGFINPKYLVVGVTYAPPGPSSNVTYTNSTLVGNTTKTTNTFSSGVNVTVKASGTIDAWTIVGGAATTITGTSSTEYTQTSGSSNEVTMSKQTTVSSQTAGTGNAFSPVNHDYDIIWLWLNPLVIYSIDMSSRTNVTWKGYGYDKNDMNGQDIFGVQVGWLNGHFGTNPSINTVLARGWVTTTEPNMIWPTGEGPGITSSDIATILLADPFAGGTYTLPTPLPSTSADGRFTQEPYPPNPVEYMQAGPGNGGGLTTTYDLQYTNTSIVGKSASHDFTQAFGIEFAFKNGTWFTNFNLDVNVTHTLKWSHTWENTLTTTKTLTKALSVTGPGCPQTSPPCVPAYTGPGQFVVYLDNLYGTFMLYPSN